MKHNIKLNIERLMLDGFSDRDGFYIGRAIEQKLTQLIRKQGWPAAIPNSRELPRLDAGSFTYSSNANPEVIGRHIATKIYSAFSSNHQNL